MAGIVDDLKTWARILHGQVKGRDRAALARLRALPELAALEDEALAASVKRKHCLAVIARGIPAPRLSPPGYALRPEAAWIRDQA